MVTMMPLIAGIGIVFVGISATIADPPNIVAECQGINLSTEISSSSILPARRTDIELITSDNLKLVGELALPSEVDPVATMLCLHPLTTHQGMMDSHIFRKAAWRLPALAQLVRVDNLKGSGTQRMAKAQICAQRLSLLSQTVYQNLGLLDGHLALM